MQNKMLKDLYDCFYTPSALSTERQEVEDCRQTLIKALEKPERSLVLRIIDAKEHIIADISIDSFISGFRMAWKSFTKLNHYEMNAQSLVEQTRNWALILYARRKTKYKIAHHSDPIHRLSGLVCYRVDTSRGGQGKPEQ